MSYLYNGGKLSTEHIVNSTIATEIVIANWANVY